MRILFWVPYPTEGASNRYRVEQYLPYLKAVGMDYSLRPFWSSAAYKLLYKKGHYFKKGYYFIAGTLRRIWDVLSISKYEIVFIHREAYPIGGAFFETWVSILKKPLIFDFDDAIFLTSSSKPNSFIERFKNPIKTAKVIKLSSHIIAGNDYLANFAGKYNHRVSVIPTPIDTDKYLPLKSKNNEKKEVVIGWIGSITTASFLNILKNVFIVLSYRFPAIKFKIVGAEFNGSEKLDVINKVWRLNEEINDLQDFDIGIMPVPDNEWTKGKCGFKAILYMSMGIPCICSPVGMNKQIISDGINGFLSFSEKEWIEKLSILIKNPEERREIGIRGRKTVKEHYSLAVNIPKYLAVIKKVHQEAQSKLTSRERR